MEVTYLVRVLALGVQAEVFDPLSIVSVDGTVVTHR